MINLSERLLTISSFIDKSDNVLDIGCDHALLDIYIEKKYNNNHIIASDVLESALEKAKENIIKYKAKKVILKCGYGLDTLDNKDINTIVISGMGYQKIIGILKNGKEKLINIEKIIIQSNTFPDKVRRYLTKNNYYIEDEKMVKDKNIIYTVILFKKGTKKYNDIELLYGPIIIKKKEKIFEEFLDIEIKKNNIILKVLPKKYFIKRMRLNIQLNKLYKLKSR